MEAPLHQSPVPLPPDYALQRQQQQPVPVQVAAGREQCPRCASRDTKFCYYNNYNTAQPRHFCRACRRYWTLGGSLRNVPIGGSARKRPRPRPRPRPAARAVVDAAAGHFSGATATSSPSPSSPAPAQDQSGLLTSLICSVPLLEGSLGFDLVLGKPGVFEAAGPLAFGAALPLLWPTRILEDDHHADAWKAAGVWQELAAAAPVEAGGLHHAAPQQL